MGAVGGMLGLGGGASGSGFGVTPGTTSEQMQTAYTGAQGSLKEQQDLLTAIKAQNGLQNQSNVYNQMQGVAAGQGPNPAQAMLNQSTGQNVANQAALMAGQRGASQNVGLMARQAGQQGANIQQQAAGQGASMQAQQSLNALGAMGNIANTQAGQQLSQTAANAQAQQNEQSILQGANSNYNQVQAALAQKQMGNQASGIGGLASGIGTGLSMLADGGPVEGVPNNVAPGAYVAPTPTSSFEHQYFQSQNQSPGGSGLDMSKGPAAEDPLQKGMSQLAGGVMNAFSDVGDALWSGVSDMGTDALAGSTSAIGSGGAGMATWAGADAAPFAADAAMVAAHGGKVPAKVSPGEAYVPPEKVKAVADKKLPVQKAGEIIPGEAKVKGDSYKNDTVSRNLDSGGVVIPRSVMQSKDPVRGAADFVKAVIMKKGKK